LTSLNPIPVWFGVLWATLSPKEHWHNMCGFIAILQDSSIIDFASARRALNALAHRGPDAEGEWRERDVFLGHRRLSIIDLATGDQPMQSADGRYMILFNGEIYNFKELRTLLASQGTVFRTQSDTEVLLEGYCRWGSQVVERIHGIFSFVIWDRLCLSAFAARDRLGIKPLCWAVYRGALIISSTLEPFRMLGEFNDLDPIAVRDLMTFDYIPAPRSILKKVRKLEPGTRFEWRFGADTPAIERYWMPPLADPAASAPDEHELEALLDQAVEQQMISDVPIGVFLSGGIDSSLLVALAARHSATPVRTFSVGFADKDADESPLAELVAQRFRTDHTVLRAEEMGADALLDLLGRFDEPFCDPTVVPTYTLSKMTRQHVKVALSGDGGDEVFGGYPKYLTGASDQPSPLLSSLVNSCLQAIPWRPRGAGHLYGLSLSPRDRLRFEWARYGDFPVFRKDLRQLLVNSCWEAAEVSDYFEPWERRASRYGRRLDADVIMRADLETYLSENCLFKTDRASMLASLEVRVPYLHETVLDRILPLPAEKKIAHGQLKALLLPIARRLLPREVWDRPKHGFNIPLNVWLAGIWRPAVDTALAWGERNFPLFDYRYLRRLHQINKSGAQIGRELWNPFVLIAWVRARSFSNSR
jgi:asparagine synthase (glutamine-hydrolysing)